METTLGKRIHRWIKLLKTTATPCCSLRAICLCKRLPCLCSLWPNRPNIARRAKVADLHSEMFAGIQTCFRRDMFVAVTSNVSPSSPSVMVVAQPGVKGVKFHSPLSDPGGPFSIRTFKHCNSSMSKFYENKQFTCCGGPMSGLQGPVLSLSCPS